MEAGALTPSTISSGKSWKIGSEKRAKVNIPDFFLVCAGGSSACGFLLFLGFMVVLGFCSDMRDLRDVRESIWWERLSPAIKPF